MKLKLLYLAILSIIVTMSVTYAIDTEATGFKVLFGNEKTITAHSTCKKITNNHASGLAIFVSTKTSSQWSNFLSNLPTGITSATCSTTCGTWQKNWDCDGSSVTYTVEASRTACETKCEADGAVCCRWLGPSDGGNLCASVADGITEYNPLLCSGFCDDQWAVACS